jgi:hypothetical protein
MPVAVVVALIAEPKQKALAAQAVAVKALNQQRLLLLAPLIPEAVVAVMEATVLRSLPLAVPVS